MEAGHAASVLGLADVDLQRQAPAIDAWPHAQPRQVDRVAELDHVVAQRHCGQPALVVGRARIVEDIQPVGLHGLVGGDLDVDRQRGALGRQHRGVTHRTVLALGKAAFDDQRPGDAVDHMFAHRLVADELPLGVGHELAVGRERHPHFGGPVAGVELHRIGHALQRGDSASGGRQRRVQRQRQRAAEHLAIDHLVGDVVHLVERGAAVHREQRADAEPVAGPAGTGPGEGVGRGAVIGAVQRCRQCRTERRQQQAVVGAAHGLGTGEHRLPVTVEIHPHRAARIADQPQPVVVAGDALDHTRAAVGFADQHLGRVVVEHAHVQLHRRCPAIGRISACEAMADGGDRSVLAHRVVHRLDRQRAPGACAPAARAEAQAGHGRAGLVEHLHLVGIEVEVHGDVCGGRERQVDLVGVADGADRGAFQHPGGVVALAHQQRAQVVVDQAHLDIGDRDAVEPLLVGLVGAHEHQAVADHDLALALQRVVVRGLHQHRARCRPIGGHKAQHRTACPGAAVVDRHQQRVGLVRAAVAGVARRQPAVIGRRDACRHREVGHGARIHAAGRHDQRDLVGVARAAVLQQLGDAAGLGDDHLALVGIGNGDGHAVNQQAVVGAARRGHGAVIDHRAATVQVLADHGLRDVARDIEGVAAQATDHGGHRLAVRAEHVEGVVTFQAVDLDRFFDAVEPDVQPGAEDAVLGDDEDIVALGADGHHGVEAEAAVDADRRVDVVFELVVVAAAVGDDVVLGNEGADHEGVVARLAFHAQHRLVAVDVEGVAAFAAEGRQCMAYALAEPAARDAQQLDVVAVRRQVDVLHVVGHHAHVVGAVARRVVVAVHVGAEHLADLEQVAAQAAVQRGDGAVVVDVELVVARGAAHQQAAVDAAVVVDALHARSKGRTAVGIDAVGFQQRHKALAQQKHVVAAGAVDRQRVGAAVGGPAVHHVEQRVGAAVAHHVDDHRVGQVAPVDVDGVAHLGVTAVGQQVAGPVVGGGQGRLAVDDQQVFTAQAQHAGMAGQLHQLAQLDAVGVVVALDHHVLAQQRAFDQDVRALGVGGSARVALDAQEVAAVDAAGVAQVVGVERAQHAGA